MTVTQCLIDTSRQRCCECVESIHLRGKINTFLLFSTKKNHLKRKIYTKSILSLILIGADPIIHDVWMWWSLHEGDGVEDVVNVVAEMENRVSDDRLCGGDAGRQ